MPMTLNDYLAPVKYIDEQVLRQYTKVGKKLKLDEGKRKYVVAIGLNFLSIQFSSLGSIHLDIQSLKNLIWYVIVLPDNIFNGFGYGLNQRIEETTGARAIDPVHGFLKKHNTLFRLPVFVGSVGCIAKYGIDLVNHVVNGVPMDQDSPGYLSLGIGYLSLASSMYIKEMDPKLLDKKPFWRTAYDRVKEKLAPEPTPITTRSIEELV